MKPKAPHGKSASEARILIILPPMLQLNTLYPSIAYLKQHLHGSGFKNVFTRDLSIELFLRVFSRSVFESSADYLKTFKNLTIEQARALKVIEEAIPFVEDTVHFLQGKNPQLAYRIISDDFLPSTKRLKDLNTDLESTFGLLGIQDQAKHLASLYIDDLSEALQSGIDPLFSLARYGEKLAASQMDFLPLKKEAERRALNPANPIELAFVHLIRDVLKETNPSVVGISTPFPGNVLGGLVFAKVLKKSIQRTSETSSKNADKGAGEKSPCKIIWGGGYVNTELRSLNDPSVFDFVDALSYDDGEEPFTAYLLNQDHPRLATRGNYFSNSNQVNKQSLSVISAPLKTSQYPDYTDTKTGRYISMLEMPNPMHRLWSDGWWNKLTIAHGCYWKKCTFCDTSLDYIGRYEVQTAEDLVHKMKIIMKQTGHTGFHFVDEAAPPALLRALSNQLIQEKLNVTWWTNLRFEKAFTPDLCALMQKSGCIAVTGGLEVASDRLLKLMNKGVSIDQVAKVGAAFTDAGILVHAYLMYGFPTETTQETIDSLEVVRQMMMNGVFQSAYWHRFSATVHSPVGRNPSQFSIDLMESSERKSSKIFAINDLDFIDKTPTPHDDLGIGLKAALSNYMLGVGFDLPLQKWFPIKVPKTKVSPKLIETALGN